MREKYNGVDGSMGASGARELRGKYVRHSRLPFQPEWVSSWRIYTRNIRYMRRQGAFDDTKRYLRLEIHVNCIYMPYVKRHTDYIIR